MKRRQIRRHFASWAAAGILGAIALYPGVHRLVVSRAVTHRIDAIEARAAKDASACLPSTISLRVQRLSPLLASWETIGGCGAGGTGGAGVGVKWIGRSTSGGLFQSVTQGNYISLPTGYNYIVTEQITRDLGTKWNFGVLVPYLYKRYNYYLGLPTDVSNAGIGDVNVMLTRKFGRINNTSVTLSVGLPTGTHDAEYKTDILTQDKQLGIGKVTGGLTLDHSLDKGWGLIVLGGSVSYRGDENELGNYRAPSASLYGYTGYYLGPFVPVLGLSFVGFLKPDRDRGDIMNVPLAMAAGNASLEWSTDSVAILAGVSVPYALAATPRDELVNNAKAVSGFQPWMVAVGISLSPF